MYATKHLMLLVIGFAVLCVVVGVVVLIIVLALRNRRSVPAEMPAPQSAPVATPEKRQAILKKLADGELTREQAEEQLNRLGSPVPTAMPPPLPAMGNGSGKGCLVAALLIIVPILLTGLIVGSLLMWRLTTVRSVKEEVMRAQLEHAGEEGLRIEMREGEGPVVVDPSESETR